MPERLTAGARAPQPSPEAIASLVADGHPDLLTILDALPVLISYIDTDTRYRFVNLAYERWFGVPRENYHGRTLREMIGDEAYQRVRPMVDAALQGKGSCYEDVLHYKSGDTYHVRIQYLPDLSPGGTPRGYVALVEDVSDLKAASAALQLNEQRARLAVEAGRVGLWDWNVNTNRISWSDITYAIHGLRPGEFDGTYEGFRALVHPDDRAMVEAQLGRALAGEGGYEVEFRTIRPGGEVRWLSTRAQLIFDAQGNPQHMFGAVTDMTERITQERSLQAAVIHLQRANEDLEQFAYAAAHDLQEPLRMVSLYSELLSKRVEQQLDPESRRYLRMATEGAGRMRLLIEDLLAYTRAVGIEQEAPAPTDTLALLQEVLRTLHPTIMALGARVSADPLPKIPVHPQRLIQVFQNLIGNALKYRSERQIEVHIGAERHGAWWRFSVRDNGQGIEPEYHERVFGVFKRLHGREVPGTGIGLAICRRVIEGYGGKIWVESAGRNAGSTFFFTLPASPESQPKGLVAE